MRRFVPRMRWLLAASFACGLAAQQQQAPRTNVVLVMADDLGYGDTGYNGHPTVKTPHLDAMARRGVVFQRFYAQAPVCSPTRGSCLTGRHPFRYGIRNANAGHLPAPERTLAEVLRDAGYRTGHFGKWHLGTLTRDVVESNRGGPRGAAHHAPPWEHGFDTCFSTEAKVPTWDPMVAPGSDGRKPYGTHYWTGPGQMAREGLAGDDSRVLVDRVVPFVKQAAAERRPFFAVVWFHAPHLPVVAGPQHRALYEGEKGIRPDYYGCITALDEQVGRLLHTLEEVGVADHTAVFFCSDNGPEGEREGDDAPGRTNGLRGRKRSLYEGGIRVPGLLVWPARVKAPMQIDAPVCTSDYLPTALAIAGIDAGQAALPLPLDGVSLLPLVDGERTTRGGGIGFRHGDRAAWITDRYKLVRNADGSLELYDLVADARESRDLAGQGVDLGTIPAEFEAWRESFR